MHQARQSVLVVDDDENIVELLCAFIDNERFEAIGVTDAEKALRLARTVPLALILSDWTMPFVSGQELAQRLRADATTAKIPLALMSGYLSSEVLATGADAYLNKPFSAEEVLTLVSNCASLPHTIAVARD